MRATASCLSQAVTTPGKCTDRCAHLCQLLLVLWLQQLLCGEAGVLLDVVSSKGLVVGGKDGPGRTIRELNATSL
jgi:hypothetical protein